MEINDKGLEGRASGENAVNKLTELAIQRNVEREKTRRLVVVLAGIQSALLMITMILIMIIDPYKLTEITLALFGAGFAMLTMVQIGITQFYLRAPGIEVDARAVQKAMHIFEEDRARKND